MSEKLKVTFPHIAPCGQKEPIEWYVQENGYPGRKCKFCGKPDPVNKLVLSSPTLEATFPYGSSFICGDCQPSIQEIATTDKYYDLLYGELKK